MIDRLWDIIIIGTGIGGGTIGRALAERGHSVLFVEQGPDGPRTEQTALNPGLIDPVSRLVRGFWPDPVTGVIDGQPRTFFAPLGAGVGGSSVFYAATLERPAPHDLDHSASHPHPTGGWPVNDAQMRPYFAAAEAMYCVTGGKDPLSDAPPLPEPPLLSAGDAEIMAKLTARGLHPYRLHAAVKYLPACAECFGHKCPRTCKMDGRSAGVDPAMATGNATLLDHCTVTALRGTPTRITHIEATHHGKPVVLRGQRIVLAAGAFGSPRLLLASTADWPQGCANSSGLVGRNLMFHLNEMFAIWPGRAFAGPSKSVGLRDLYHVGGKRFGMVQAMGIEASYGEIVHYLRAMLDRSPLRRLSGLVRLPALIGAKVLGNAKVFVGLMEDLPYLENRVTVDPANPGRISFTYALRPELLARRKTFRRLIRQAFAGLRPLFLTHTPELNYGHPCGTVRYGTDPATSVLTPDCRAHDLENLWVVDASFFPTAMGVNPSLTIAANALRVADKMEGGV